MAFKLKQSAHTLPTGVVKSESHRSINVTNLSCSEHTEEIKTSNERERHQ